MLFDGRYEATKLLHERRGTRVFAGLDRLLRRRVAIKFLTGFETPQARAAFLQEATLVASLEHPNIVRIYAHGEGGSVVGGDPGGDAVDEGDDGGERAGDLGVWFVMRYVEGEMLSWASHGRGLLSGEALRLLLPVAGALDYAHRHGIQHRAVKPRNIRVQDDLGVFLMDLGLAYGPWTRGAPVEGQPDYRAPEARGAVSTDPRSDQYSLAVVARELLTGSPPPAVGGVNSDRDEAASGALPPGLAEPLRRALSPRPEDRFSSCLEFFAALGLRRPTPTSSRAAPAPPEPSSAPSRETVRVLVIEDELADYLIVQRQLDGAELARFRCQQVSTLADLSADLTMWLPDVLLVDLTLPDSEGLETVRHVRALAPGLPIVIQTGDDDPELARGALALGAQDFVAKGEADARTLARALMHAIDRHGQASGSMAQTLVLPGTQLLSRPALIDRLEMNLAHAGRRGVSCVLALLEPGPSEPPIAELVTRLAGWESLGLLRSGQLGFTAEVQDSVEAALRVRELLREPGRWRVRLATSPDQGTSAEALLRAVGAASLNLG